MFRLSFLVVFFTVTLYRDAVAEKTKMSYSVIERIATMSANDQGISLQNTSNSIQRFPERGEKELKGYLGIGVSTAPIVPEGTPFIADLYLNLAIRIDTADVIETNTCTILRYPDLMEFRREWLKRTGNKPVSLEQIRNEVSCETLKVVPVPKHSHAVK